MPTVLQVISHVVPASYFLPIVRGIMLKGNTLPQLLTPVLFLAGMSTLLLTISWRKFKLNLEQ